MSCARPKSKIILQNDWSKVLRDNEGRAWITYKAVGEPSISGELRSQGLNDERLPIITASEGFSVGNISERSIEVCFIEKNLKTKFIAPTARFESIHKKSVESLDISAGGELGVSAGSDGLLQIWQTNNGTVRRNLEGHAGDVSTCQFFPSGVVVLSGGLDTQLKIWSVEDGSCPQTLRGHEGGILGTDVIDRGRNIVSCSRDGTARLWDCGEGKCLDVLYKGDGSPVNGCAVGVPDSSINLGNPEKPTGEREVGTEGKLLMLAVEDKTLRGVGVRSRKEIFTVHGPAAFNCCGFISSEKVLGGCQDGTIHVVDVRNPSSPAQVIQLSSSPVLCIQGFRDGFIAGTGDGSCFHHDLNTQSTHEFTGPDCDPIYDFSYHGDMLYTACRDHIIRKYRV